MNDEKLAEVLKAWECIFRILDNLKYECSSREYTLSDDEMGSVFYCRDLSWKMIELLKKES